MRWKSLPEICVVAALIVVAVTVRFAYHREEMSFFPQHPDGYEYHRLAHNLLRGREYGWILGTGHFYRYARTPGYPLFIAAVYGVAGVRPLALRTTDLLLGALAVLLAYGLARRLFGRAAAVMAALLLCFYWRAVMFSADYLTETLFVFLILAAVYLLLRSGGRFYFPLCAAGLLLGFAVLVRPNALGFVPALFLWPLCRREPWKNRVVAVVVLAASTAALPAVWAGYHRVRYSAPPALSLSSIVGARSLWEAHNPAVGDEVDNRGVAAANELRFQHFDLPEKEWAALLKSHARGYFLESPGRCIGMALLRFRKHWLGAGIMDGEGTLYPESGRNRYGILYWYERFWKPSAYFRDDIYVTMHFKKRLMIGFLRVPLLTFEGLVYLLFIFLAAGCVLHIRHVPSVMGRYMRRSSLLLLMILFYILFHFAGFVHHRLRFPLEPLICILAGGSFSIALEGVVRLFSPGPHSWLCPEGEERGGIHGVWIALAAAIILIVTASFVVSTISRVRGDLIEKCSLATGAASYAASIGGDVDFEDLQRHRGAHRGSVEPFIGKRVVWTGEATFLRAVDARELRHEPPPYREAWRMLAAGVAPEALFFRLVIGGYERPEGRGRGEALVMTVPGRVPGLAEGDPVTVEGRIAGADNDVMGYPIIAAEGVYVWGSSPLAGGGRS